MPKEPKRLNTGVMGTIADKEIDVRFTPIDDEVGIIDKGQGVVIYWSAKDNEKIIQKLKEVVE